MASSINASTSGAGGLITTADNTGILNLQTAGTTAVTVDASQNVGIGTSSPGYKLDVNGTINANVDIINTGGRLSLYRSAGASYIDWSSGQALAFRTETSAGGASPTEYMRIDSTGYVTNAVNGLGNGLHQAYQYYRLNSGYAGANVNTVQSIFGVGVTLVGSTVYEFEIVVTLTKSAGTTAHTSAIGFGGTATVNNIGYTVSNRTTGSVNAVGAPDNLQFIQTTTATTASASITATTSSFLYIIKGTVSINAGGTFIPQYTLSAAPGGAYTTQIGSYIKISPLSASGANTSVGTWA